MKKIGILQAASKLNLFRFSKIFTASLPIA